MLNLHVLHRSLTGKDVWEFFSGLFLFQNIMNQEMSKEGNIFIQGIDAYSFFVSQYFQKATCFTVSDNWGIDLEL